MPGGAGSSVVRAAAALLLFTLAACPAPQKLEAPVSSGHDAPRRIVSMNPCIDTILREVAEPAQIAAISHYSQDPRAASVPLDWARRFPAVGDGAEDIIAMRPDLVIAGPHVAPQTVMALERLGVRLMRFGVPATVAESKAQISDVARAVRHEERARTLNLRIDEALRAARPDGGSHRPATLIWQDSGLVPGEGTLASELLARTGFRNASAGLGLGQWDKLSLEALLWASPDVVMTGRAGMEAGNERSRGNEGVHPALRMATGRAMMIADFPAHLLHCGGPMIIPAAARLAKIRHDWEGRRGS